MQAIVETKALKEAVGLIERVVPRAPQSSLRALVMVQAGEEGLRLLGGDGAHDLELRLAARVEGRGRALVPAGVLARLAHSAPGEEVALRLEEGQGLELRSGPFEGRLSVSDPTGYPDAAFGPTSGKLSAPALLGALGRVRYATASSGGGYAFRCVLLELAAGGATLRAVASDGYRLALQGPPLTPGPRLLLPREAVDDVLRVFKDEEAELAWGVADGTLTLEGGRARMALRLGNGDFPDYERVIPREWEAAAELEAEALRHSLQRLRPVLGKEPHRVDLTFLAQGLHLAAAGEWGRSEEELPAKVAGRTPFSVSYNVRYLLEALAPLEGRVRLEPAGAARPTRVEAAEPDGYQAVVMPLKV